MKVAQLLGELTNLMRSSRWLPQLSALNEISSVSLSLSDNLTDSFCLPWSLFEQTILYPSWLKLSLFEKITDITNVLIELYVLCAC